MKHLVLILLMLGPIPTFSQVQLTWFNYPGGVSVATDASDNVYTANWDYNSGGDITLTKRNAAGQILWEAPYNNTDLTRHEVATWVETDGSGNILVSGTIRSGYSNPVNANSLLMKFDPSGKLLWRVVYESNFDGSSTKKCIVDGENNIYVLGLGNSGTGLVTQVKKFSPSGTPIWNYFDNAGIGAPVNFKLTPDNNILIVSRGISGSINGYAKISLEGKKIWSLAGINSLTVGDAAGDSNGNTYLINGQYVVSNAGSVVKKLSPAGTLLWEKVNTMAGLRVEVGTDNNAVISGYPNSGTFGAAFMKYNTDGNVLWSNQDADGPGYALLAHAQMKMDGSNAAYVAAGTMSQMAVCKVNSDGTSAWTGTTSSGYASCMDFGTDNSVFVVGGTTAKLSQSGIVTPVAAPSSLIATAAGTTTINLSWTDNATNETNIVVQRSLLSGGSFVTIATLSANTSSYSNSGLNSATTYYFRVQATNLVASSSWSNIATATTATPPLTPPAAPGNLVAVNKSCNAITLTWNDNSANEAKFELRRSLSLNGTYSTIATLTANTTTYTNTGLTRGKRYYYMVRATNSAGSSTWSNKANAIASCPATLKSGELKEAADLFTEETNTGIRLFPNPVTSGEFFLNLADGTTFPALLSIYSSTGQIMLEKELYNFDNTIQTANLKNGIYILRISTKERKQTIKLQINN